MDARSAIAEVVAKVWVDGAYLGPNVSDEEFAANLARTIEEALNAAGYTVVPTGIVEAAPEDSDG
jgi:nitrogen regulatory protein PII-like uncharacterized protein